MSTPVKVVTYQVSPPIPIRDYDWCAFEDGHEEAMKYGWGKTEKEAVEALIDLLNEDSE